MSLNTASLNNTASAQEWADALVRDYLTQSTSQKRAFVDAKISKCEYADKNAATEQLRVLSIPEKVPGQHKLALHRLMQSTEGLSQAIVNLTELQHVAISAESLSTDTDTIINAAKSRVDTLIGLIEIINQANCGMMIS